MAARQGASPPPLPMRYFPQHPGVTPLDDNLWDRMPGAYDGGDVDVGLGLAQHQPRVLFVPCAFMSPGAQHPLHFPPDNLASQAYMALCHVFLAWVQASRTEDRGARSQLVLSCARNRDGEVAGWFWTHYERVVDFQGARLPPSAMSAAQWTQDRLLTGPVARLYELRQNWTGSQGQGDRGGDSSDEEGGSVAGRRAPGKRVHLPSMTSADKAIWAPLECFKSRAAFLGYLFYVFSARGRGEGGEVSAAFEAGFRDGSLDVTALDPLQGQAYAFSPINAVLAMHQAAGELRGEGGEVLTVREVLARHLSAQGVFRPPRPEDSWLVPLEHAWPHELSHLRLPVVRPLIDLSDRFVAAYVAQAPPEDQPALLSGYSRLFGPAMEARELDVVSWVDSMRAARRQALAPDAPDAVAGLGRLVKEVDQRVEESFPTVFTSTSKCGASLAATAKYYEEHMRGPAGFWRPFRPGTGMRGWARVEGCDPANDWANHLCTVLDRGAGMKSYRSVVYTTLLGILDSPRRADSHGLARNHRAQNTLRLDLVLYSPPGVSKSYFLRIVEEFLPGGSSFVEQIAKESAQASTAKSVRAGNYMVYDDATIADLGGDPKRELSLHRAAGLALGNVSINSEGTAGMNKNKSTGDGKMRVRHLAFNAHNERTEVVTEVVNYGFTVRATNATVAGLEAAQIDRLHTIFVRASDDNDVVDSFLTSGRQVKVMRDRHATVFARDCTVATIWHLLAGAGYMPVMYMDNAVALVRRVAALLCMMGGVRANVRAIQRWLHYAEANALARATTLVCDVLTHPRDIKSLGDLRARLAPFAWCPVICLAQTACLPGLALFRDDVTVLVAKVLRAAFYVRGPCKYTEEGGYLVSKPSVITYHDDARENPIAALATYLKNRFGSTMLVGVPDVAVARCLALMVGHGDCWNLKWAHKNGSVAISRVFLHFCLDADGGAVWQALSLAMDPAQPQQDVFRPPDDLVRPFEVSPLPAHEHGKPLAHCNVMLQKLSDRKGAAERELAEALARLATAETNLRFAERELETLRDGAPGPPLAPEPEAEAWVPFRRPGERDDSAPPSPGPAAATAAAPYVAPPVAPPYVAPARAPGPNDLAIAEIKHAGASRQVKATATKVDFLRAELAQVVRHQKDVRGLNQAARTGQVDLQLHRVPVSNDEEEALHRQIDCENLMDFHEIEAPETEPEYRLGDMTDERASLRHLMSVTRWGEEEAKNHAAYYPNQQRIYVSYGFFRERLAALYAAVRVARRNGPPENLLDLCEGVRMTFEGWQHNRAGIIGADTAMDLEWLSYMIGGHLSSDETSLVWDVLCHGPADGHDGACRQLEAGLRALHGESLVPGPVPGQRRPRAESEGDPSAPSEDWRDDSDPEGAFRDASDREQEPGAPSPAPRRPLPSPQSSTRSAWGSGGGSPGPDPVFRSDSEESSSSSGVARRLGSVSLGPSARRGQAPKRLRRAASANDGQAGSAGPGASP